MPRISRHISRVLKEPLLHFLVIGGLIFGVYNITADPETGALDDRVIVTADDIARLRILWEKRWQRPPTGLELGALIDEHIREQVLYREALALGLDRNDSLIRRLLRQKFEFVMQDLAAAREPGAAELAAWFEANRERYRTQPRLSFTQVYFDIDRRGMTGEQDARLALASLKAGDQGAEDVGDGRLLRRVYRDSSVQEIALLFGQEFADALPRLELGVWSGPIHSGYGLHLVRLEDLTPGVVPSLAEVEDGVRGDWSEEQRHKSNEVIYQRLLARYEVVVEEMPGEGGSGIGGARP